MATGFRIHEDLTEKENQVQLAGKSVNVGAGLKQQIQQRSTFGVLNNLAGNGRTAAALANIGGDKAALKDPKLKVKPSVLSKQTKNVDENAIVIPSVNHAKTVLPKPAEPFKTFQVYDDSKENSKLTAKATTKDESLADAAKREPLQELKNAELLETPMSVSESLSPMSVDKSVALIEADSSLAVDILAYLREAEKRHRPKPLYMKKQPDINQSMRTILVDWLVEVCEEYRLQNETLCLAISYIDRFLSFMSVVRAKLQLVGTAAMFIAAKYEEIYPPDVGEFVYITDDTYSKTQVLRMEQLILKVLGFDLSVPTTLVFTSVYCVMNDVPDKVKYMCMYLCELPRCWTPIRT
ncbi:hypothetical protein pipiens_012329, partial [Culex pipiens pipiens]